MKTFFALSSVIFLCSSSWSGKENSDNTSVRQFEFRLSRKATLNSSTNGDFLQIVEKIATYLTKNIADQLVDMIDRQALWDSLVQMY